MGGCTGSPPRSTRPGRRPWRPGSPTSRAALWAAQARERRRAVRLPSRAKARMPSIASRGRLSEGAFASNSGSTRSTRSAAQMARSRRSSSLMFTSSTRTSHSLARVSGRPPQPRFEKRHSRHRSDHGGVRRRTRSRQPSMSWPTPPRTNSHGSAASRRPCSGLILVTSGSAAMPSDSPSVVQVGYRSGAAPNGMSRPSISKNNGGRCASPVTGARYRPRRPGSGRATRPLSRRRRRTTSAAGRADPAGLHRPMPRDRRAAAARRAPPVPR